MAVSELAVSECPMRYGDLDTAPSTRELVNIIVADPDATIPLWQESIGRCPQDLNPADTVDQTRILAFRSEIHALLGVVINGFAQELDDYRAAQPPFGLLSRTYPSWLSTQNADAKPTLDWVIDSLGTSAFAYLGDYLKQLRNGDAAKAKPIRRLDEHANDTARRRAKARGVAGNVVRDESQQFINLGLRTATSVNCAILKKVEASLRTVDPDIAADTIAETARRSYRLPLELARLSLTSTFFYTELFASDDVLSLLQDGASYRAVFSSPVQEKLQSFTDLSIEDPDALGCPANVKVGSRMIDELWQWNVDVAERANVWE